MTLDINSQPPTGAPAKKVGGSFKLALVALAFFLIGLIVFLMGHIIKYPDQAIYKHGPAFILVLSGCLGFVGIIYGLGELFWLIILPKILKLNSPIFRRSLAEKPKLIFVIIGTLANLIIWVSAIILFLEYLPKDMDKY